jgi:hypothetical protein
MNIENNSSSFSETSRNSTERKTSMLGSTSHTIEVHVETSLG